MLCYISQPNAYALVVEVEPKANGQECLDKVCEQLGIIEEDYFGIQYIGSKGEHLWLNMRNRIEQQLCGSPPYRLQLRVKFYVQPHLILQESTRHQFYLQVKQDLHLQRITLTGDDQIVRIAALIVHAEHGNYQCHHNNAYQHNLYSKLLHGIVELTSELLQRVTMEHASLQGMSKASAEYHMIQELSTLQGYGIEYHDARTSDGQTSHAGVGPKGIFLFGHDMQLLQKIAFPLVKLATVNGRSCLLRYWEEDGEEVMVELKLVSHKAASALYRSVTEMMSFFFCDTIMDAVSTQYSRDLKGTIASLFNENSSLGKQFIFDIKRTGTEAYDHARRLLYTRQPPRQEMQMEMDSVDDGTCDNQPKMYKDKITKTIKDSFLCQVCMDASIDIAFCPCGHVVCCQLCSQQLEKCPICRTDIENRQMVYLPQLSLDET